MGMTQHYPGDPWYPSFPDITGSVLRFIPSLLIAAAGALLAALFLPKTPLFNHLILNAALPPPTSVAPTQGPSVKVGQGGLTETRLNPAGAARFGDLLLNVVSRGEFIESGEKIVIAEVRGNRIIVERLKNA
jgi:membrane-bound serine protease (ClpP class)